MSGTYDGKRVSKKKPLEWCPDESQIVDGCYKYVKMNKKYRCPTCNKRLKPTLRGVSCWDTSCVEYHTHAHFPRHKAK